MRVLILEDDAVVAELLKAILEKDGIDCQHCGSLREALFLFQREDFTVALVDRMLGGDDGLDFVRWARERRPSAGIIIISARNVADDRIQGIADGADDYLTKPFEPREVLVRVRRLAQRLGQVAEREGDQLLRFAGFRLDPQERTLLGPDGDAVNLTGKEFTLLLCLVRANQTVVDRDRLSMAVHGRSWNPLERGIDILASKVRLKLRAAGAAESLLRSIRGEGYLLSVAVEFVDRT
ncbi:MAG: response regulator transcription factor [Pseudomonadota bacterium]|nr:response regulator transcription factor [Pseudomonadota bacterium]